MPHVATYVGLADHSEQILADSLRAVADGHARQADVFHTCRMLAGWSDEQILSHFAARDSIDAIVAALPPLALASVLFLR